MQKKKDYANNVTIVLDKETDARFASYNEQKDSIEGQEHDAGFDSFMTGHVFAKLAKYIEIGKTIGIME